MRLFYFDETLKRHEDSLALPLLVEYLEAKFDNEKDLKILTTIIGYSWYYFIEGLLLFKHLNKDEVDDILCFLQSKWKKYIDLGLQDYADISEFCYIAGYTLGLDWFMVDPNYGDKKGIELLQKCYNTTKNESLKALAKNFLDNSAPSRKFKKLENAERICAELFPSYSELDKHFKEILIK